MHRLDNAFPTSQTLITVNIRNTGISAGRDVVDAGSFSNDQANTTGCTLAVILDAGIGWDIVRRLIAGHGRHYDTIVKFESPDGRGAE